MKSIYRFWTLALTSPLVYLVICLIINQRVFSRRAAAGFWPMPVRVYDWLFTGLAIAGMATLPAVYWLKSRWACKAPDRTDEEAPLTQHPRGRRFLTLFMICDTVALIGLVLFLIQGRTAAMLFFGTLGLLDYAMAFPGQPEEK
jgi:hypothetical protein